MTYDDVFAAILSMDVYHRSNNRGVFTSDSLADLNADANSGTNIGSAEIIARLDDEAHSFFAIAYRYNGKIYITYRGTDNIGPGINQDMLNGWTVAAGLGENNQAGLAVAFYESVLNENGYPGQTVYEQAPANIVITGHSLGGGLAGMVAMLSNANAVVIDAMPYGVAGAVAYISRVVELISESETASAFLGATDENSADRLASLLVTLPTLGIGVIGAALGELISQGKMPIAPNWEHIKGFFVSNELMEHLRNGVLPALGGLAGLVLSGVGSTTPLSSVLVPVGAAIAALGGGYTAAFLGTTIFQDHERLETFGWDSANTIDRHSAALDVFLQYAKYKEGIYGTWHQDKSNVNALLDAFFNDEVGKAIGLKAQVDSAGNEAPPYTAPDPSSYTGFVKPSDQMLRMIAYSAIEGGTAVFGTTAIKSILNDAEDLSGALALDSNTLKKLAPELAQILVQFGGQLAYGKIEQSLALDGVMTLSGDHTLLTVTFSDDLWTLAKDEEKPELIYGRDQFVSSILESAGAVAQMSSNMSWLWGAESTEIIDRFVIATTPDSINTTLAEPVTVGGIQEAVTLIVASDGNDEITGSTGNDFVFGGDGNDSLNGGNGNDLLAGGAGADTFMFSSAAVNGRDTISDFQHLSDRLVFAGADYGFSAGQSLSSTEFTAGTSAVGTSAQFVWDGTGKKLYWDPDGTDATAAIELAILTGATVTKEDLYFV